MDWSDHGYGLYIVIRGILGLYKVNVGYATHLFRYFLTHRVWDVGYVKGNIKNILN